MSLVFRMLPCWALLVAVLVGSTSAQYRPDLQSRLDAAVEGDTIVVEGGLHEGPFHVETSVVLIGRGRPHLKGDGSTHVLQINASEVTVEGFRITASGTNLNQDHAGILVNASGVTLRDNHLSDVLHGIYVKGKNQAVIVENLIEGPPTVTRRMPPEEARSRNCTVPPDGGDCEVPLPLPQRGNGIHLWKSTHNTVTHNTVYGTRDGIYFSFTDHTYAAYNTVRDVRYGLHFMYSDDNTFEHNEFYDNASGSALMFSFRLTARHNLFHDNRSQRGYGLLLQTMDESRFAYNRMTENGTGVYLENSTRNVFEANTVRANYRGLRFTGSSMENQFGENVIRGNLITATVAGASTTNEWQVRGRGNYWGPRGLLDANGDGISELPHHTVDLFGGVRGSFPLVDLLAASPGLTLLAEALSRVSGTGVPTITDPRPLLRPPGDRGKKTDSGLVLAAALGLTLMAVGYFTLRRRRR